MKRFFPFLWLLLLYRLSLAQDIEYLGLANSHITSLKIGNGLVAVGTKYNGVYWQPISDLSDSTWNKIIIDSVNVTSVYPHKSGPVGWAIGIGAEPNLDNSEFIFCSFLGGTPKPMSYGIDINNTIAISSIDGFPDPTICGETFALGGSKLYRRYFNDTTWHSVYECFEGGLMSLKAREESGYVYAGGGEGFTGILLIRSSDKGNTWENLFPFCYVQDLDFYGDTIHKIIVSDGYKVLLSFDNGTTWGPILQTDTLMIRNISFSPDGSEIYIITSTLFYDLPRTYFFYTSNFRTQWSTVQLPIYDIIVGMDIGFDDFIYLASISSGVFKLKLPIVKIEDESERNSPGEFILYQNYPNPFNPTTKIKYTIPTPPSSSPLVKVRNEVAFVSLKIYDVLGNEVATLIDEYNPAGSYEVEFQSTVGNKQLASGIYYYQLRAGSFVQTKKMILIK